MKNNINKHFLQLFIYSLFLSFIFISNCKDEISVGKLTILTHTQQTAINKTITLTPLSYHEHLPNMEMLAVRVIKADPFDACSPIDFAKIYPKTDFSYPATFLMVDGQSGACNYWKKAQIAQQSLAKGIIIIDDDPDKNGLRPADFNDGLFLSFLIHPKDAKLILPAQEGQFEGKLSILQQKQQKEKKKIYLWLSSLNEKSYEIISWWNQTLHNLPELDKKVLWEPKYVFYGKSTDQSKHVYSCACNGLFCSPQYHGKTSDVLIKQDLRQKLIFKVSPQKYMRYIELFTSRCLQSYLKQKFVQECARTQMINTQINQTQINKQIQNFLFSCDKDSNLFGQLLTDKGRFSMIGTYPVILLGRQILQINNQNELQAAICRKFSLQESQGCIQNYRTTIQQIVISIMFFLLILLGLFGIGFFVVMCYKNKLRKQMHKQVRMQVSTAVEHYFQLSEDTSAKN